MDPNEGEIDDDARSTQSVALDESPEPAAAPAPANKRARGPQVKRWCFTVNNPEDWNPRPHCNGDVAFCIWQTERGAEGTLHIQGYVRFNSRKSMNTVKQFFNNQRMHLEPSRGTEHDNVLYCSKEEGRVADGSRGTYGVEEPSAGQQGHRSDLEKVAEDAKAGKSIKEIAEAHSVDFIRYSHGIIALHDLVAPAPAVARVVTAVCFWGPTNMGKTHRVLTRYPDVYQVLGRGRGPWDNYSGQSVLLLDEFDWEKWSAQELNVILDKWRFRLDCRYHDKYAAWSMVFICCNDNPEGWYSNCTQALRNSVRRRLSSGCHHIDSREPTIEQVLTGPCEPNWAQYGAL